MRDFKDFLQVGTLNKEWLLMKKDCEIHRLGVCENGDVTEAFQNMFRETQDLEMPGMTDSGSEMCCQK